MSLSLAVAPVFAAGQTQVRKGEARLVVSFYSICCGTNREALEKLDKFIRDYERAQGKRLAKVTGYWGKEGEEDYCFRLLELSAREQRRFISRVRGLLKNSELVHVNENAPCRNER